MPKLRRGCLPAIVLVITLAACETATARDVLEAVVKKSKLSRNDRATIETEVAERVKKLLDGAKNPRRRREAREALIATARVAGASRAGLDAYAEACADELTGPMTQSNQVVALDAALILVSLENRNTAEALARALSSEHAGVRYTAAEGLRKLHKAVARQRRTCRSVLKALAQAGAAENHELVLREIYRAINFAADVSNFALGDEAARALVRVFAGRLDRLASGCHDEWKDLEGYVAAGACYAAAKPETRRELVRHLARFLSIHVDRYCNGDIAASYLPTLRRVVAELEKSLRAMMRASNVRPPRKNVSTAIRRKPGNRAKREARAALADLNARLAGDPWRLP